MTPADAPTPPEWIAPGPDTLDAAVDTLATRLESAVGLQEAAARWQNARQPGDRTCDAAAVSYFHFADAWRVAAQRARAQAQRVQWLLASPALDAVRAGDRRLRIDSLLAEAEVQGKAWGVFSAWHERYGPRCDVLPEAPTAGSPGGPAFEGPRVVWVVGGMLCPKGTPASGLTVVDEPVCVATSCGPDVSGRSEGLCVPSLPDPGAVLSP